MGERSDIWAKEKKGKRKANNHITKYNWLLIVKISGTAFRDIFGTGICFTGFIYIIRMVYFYREFNPQLLIYFVQFVAKAYLAHGAMIPYIQSAIYPSELKSKYIF